MNCKINKIVVVAMAIAMGFCAYGELLVYDGFKVDPNQKNNNYNHEGKQGQCAYNIAGEVIGFKTKKDWPNEAPWSYPNIAVVTNQTATLPEYYTSALKTNNGAMKSGDEDWHHSVTEKGRKWVYRDFSDAVKERLETENKVYFRVILGCDNLSVFPPLLNKTPSSNDYTSYGIWSFGAGFGTTFDGMQAVNQAGGNPREDNASLLFVFSTTTTDTTGKGKNYQAELALRLADVNSTKMDLSGLTTIYAEVNGLNVHTNVITEGTQYTLIPTIGTNVAYLCIAEVTLNAGRDGATTGNDLIRARAVPLDEHFGKHLPTNADEFFNSPSTVTSGEFDIMGPNDGNHIKHAILGGRQYTCGWWEGKKTKVFYDEIGVATEFKDLCPTKAMTGFSIIVK